MLYRLVDSFLAMYGIGEKEMSLVDSGIGDNLFLLAGIFCCRFPLLAPLGRTLIFTGLKKHWGRLVGLTARVRMSLVSLP